jgi:formate hydrogenlyase subunit 3/multisubunit Na+/H+ antiporter MnhD subunit
MAVAVLFGCVLLLLGVSATAIVVAGRSAATPLVYGASLLASGLAFVAALAQLVSAGPASALVLPLGLPWLGMHLRVDALAAFFLAVVNLGGGAASLYALGYGRHETAPQRVLPFFPAFLAAMNLVVLADDAFTFLLAWEFMSLASWALVLAHHEDAENVGAGYLYLVMASFGTLMLLLAFGLLAGADGSYGFAAIRSGAHGPLLGGLVLGLMLLGAGSKAGLVPLHVWLPRAHPAAPSHVSALMSAVMTKVAVYGFVRVVFDLLGRPDWWWALLVLAVGAVTAVLGVLYALMQHDLKRLLAYHTVENIGIIFIGIGLALAFQADGMAAAAALALTAALFHVFNHSLFKGLLFFGAGAVQTATRGERDMERLGGLIRFMPVTSLAVLVGCAAISALPPLNGFASEWLTFQAILQGAALPQWSLRLAMPAAGAMLALAAALAAACFVKAYGVAFLGRPRGEAAARAGEVDGFSRVTMLGLAGLCLLAGVLPGVAVDLLRPVTQDLIGGTMPPQIGQPWLALVPALPQPSSYSGMLVFLFVAVAAAASALAIHRLASRAVRRAPAWDCGFPEPSPRTQYTAGSFAQPIRRVFGPLAFGARERVEMPPPGATAPAHFALTLRDRVWDGLYAPTVAAVETAAVRLNVFQFLTIRRYLAIVFATLVALLIALALWP